jgi:hypothetical protein
VSKRLADTFGSLPVALHPGGKQPGRVTAPGMKDVVAAGAAPRIGRTRSSRQPRIADRVVLASVADAPLAYPALQDSLGGQQFNGMHGAFWGQLLHGRKKNADLPGRSGEVVEKDSIRAAIVNRGLEIAAKRYSDREVINPAEPLSAGRRGGQDGSRHVLPQAEYVLAWHLAELHSQRSLPGGRRTDHCDCAF